MIASLPWYDLPEIRDHTDALWRAISCDLTGRGHTAVPANLNRHVDFEDQWRNPDLFFSQACGYDVALCNRQYLQVVATPRYSAPGCEGARYRSFVVVHADSRHSDLADTRGGRFIANSPTSHSGMSSLRALVAPLNRGGRFFESIEFSGSHEKSIEIVQSGGADVAAIDCVTYALLAEWRPAALDNLRILCQTEPVAAPPYVTSQLFDSAMHAALQNSLYRVLTEASTREICKALLIDGIDLLTPSAYDRIAKMEKQAVRLGYREMPFFVK